MQSVQKSAGGGVASDSAAQTGLDALPSEGFRASRPSRRLHAAGAPIGTAALRSGCDVTPVTIHNWIPASNDVLQVSAKASLHERIALCWLWAEEVGNLLGAIDQAAEADFKAPLLSMARDRSDQLRTLMASLGAETASDAEGAHRE